jgi:hypothetical protein
MSKPETPRRNPKAKPGPLQRLGSAIQNPSLKNLRPSRSPKASLQSAGHCAGNVTAKDAKHTKRNPRRPWSEAENPQKTTKETKMQTAPSFS